MYQVDLRRKAVKDLSGIPKEYARLVARHIDGLSENPRPPGAKRLKAAGGYTLRVGVFRVLYDIDDTTRNVTIFRIRHRREAYR
jgi:mRNA interferase RelE/StbE